MGDTTIYRWADDSLVVDEWCDVNPGPVRVADSFLVVDGAVVAFERHIDRFFAGVATQGIDFSRDAFVNAVLSVVPRSGRWFPRLEVVSYRDGALPRVLIRPAPEASRELTVASASRDPRTNPTVKGPDLAALGALRRESGADEAVILTDGFVTEGAWSSLVWWHDEQLHRVDPYLPRLAGVTEHVVLDHAHDIGTPVTASRVRPGDLDDAEVWVLSALHGIRVVTEWADGPRVAQESGRVEYWRQQYENRREPLPGD